jgi:hypothetical protein
MRKVQEPIVTGVCGVHAMGSDVCDPSHVYFVGIGALLVAMAALVTVTTASLADPVVELDRTVLPDVFLVQPANTISRSAAPIVIRRMARERTDILRA